MYQVTLHKDAGFGLSALLSVILHGAVFAAVLWWGNVIPQLGPVQTTYYVDIVNLPVADPRSGSPTGNAGQEKPAATLPPPPAAMTAPPSSPPRAVPGASKTPSTESTAFAERMASLEGKVDAQRQAAAFEELRKRVAARGKVGMPRGTGSESGSDYTAYLHSRLKDAFRETISYQSRSPFVMVRLTIDGTGRIIRTRMEKSSGDRVFELSVTRAITLAEQTIVPPPNRAVYEGAFVFKPQGVTQQ